LAVIRQCGGLSHGLFGKPGELAGDAPHGGFHPVTLLLTAQP